MSRSTTLGGVMGLMLLVAAAPANPAVPEAKGKEPPRTARQAQERLAQSVKSVEFEANTPLRDALAFLNQTNELTIFVDSEAFRADLQIAEPENSPVSLAKMQNVRLETVLRHLVRQVAADYYIHPDGTICIVPRDTLVSRLLREPVSATFEKKPLSEALKQLSEQAGFSIVLDERRAGDKAKANVTADFRNVSLEAAVTILADLAELKAVAVDRTLYVTTTENARAIRLEQERKQQEEQKRKENAGFGGA